MPTEHILALLIAERDKLNKAIEALSGPTKRRGRPPKKQATAATPAVPPLARKKRRKLTAAQREAAAERMRQTWTTKRKAEAKSQPKAAGKPKMTPNAA